MNDIQHHDAQLLSTMVISSCCGRRKSERESEKERQRRRDSGREEVSELVTERKKMKERWLQMAPFRSDHL